jgi:Ran GTPase-activating protein (RanGAP) involved in mRNA processing and transport
MNQNRFHQPAIESLKKYLKNNSILKHLEMRNCNLQPEAGDAIGTGLTKNNTLCRLYLGNNSLGNFGVVSLVSGIRTNESLRILDLKNNKFDTEGGKELLEYLIENK